MSASSTTPTLEVSRTIRTMQAAMHVLFLVLFAVGLVRAVVARSSAADLAAVLAASAVFVGLYGAGLGLERRADACDATPATLPSQLWICALVAAWVGLLWVAVDFDWLAFALYFLVLHVARRPLAVALVALVLTASVVALSATTSGAGAVIGPVMGMLVALGIAWVYAQLRRESETRRRLVDQLVAAQDDVLAAQEELAQTQHRAGVLAERERLARDIHDTLAQGFSSILLLSRAGLAGAATDDARTRLLRQIEETAGDGLTQAREVVHALAPAELTEAPLFAALERLARRLDEHSDITATATLEGEARPLPAALDVALLRIAQSALANVRLHSDATRTAVTLTYAPKDVTLEVIDDGVGFTEDDVARAPLSGSGFGLRAMRERVEALGGRLEIESEPGQGAALVVSLPTAVESR